MKITVCIGSSCHIKGSRQVVEQLQYLISENKLGDKVELGGTFCMGKCQHNGLFKPDESVKRSVIVTTLYRMAGEPEVTDDTACKVFSDVPVNEWYSDAVCWAYTTGITTGNTSTMKFNTNDYVTREQLAAFFYRYAKYMGEDVSARGDLSTMLNADQVKEYSKDAVCWAVGAGLISGKGVKDEAGNPAKDLAPQASATRAQLAAILQRFDEK